MGEGVPPACSKPDPVVIRLTTKKTPCTNFEIRIEFNLTLYSSSTSYVEYQAGGGKGLVDLVNQLTLERCHSF